MLLLWFIFKEWAKCLISEFDGQVPDILHIYAQPKFYVIGSKIGLKELLDMMILLNNKYKLFVLA